MYMQIIIRDVPRLSSFQYHLGHSDPIHVDEDNRRFAVGRQVNEELIWCHRALLLLFLAIYVLLHGLVVAEWRPEVTLDKHSTIVHVLRYWPTCDKYRKPEEAVRGHTDEQFVFLACFVLHI